MEQLNGNGECMLCVFCVYSIELDDDQSDAESTGSSPDAFANIPLPSATVSLPSLSCTSPTNSSSPTLDAIPLPKSPVGEKSVTDSHVPLSSSETVGHRAKVDAHMKTDETLFNAPVGDAVHAKTSIGTITLLLNRKLGPRLSKASVFDVPDDNAKEVNSKLVKLRRLKRMKKNKDGVSELDGGSATGRKALQQRISEWKEELLNDQNFKKSKHYDSKEAFDMSTTRTVTGDIKENQPNTAAEGDKTETKNHMPAVTTSEIKTEAVDLKLVPNLKSDDSYMIKLYDTFMKVSACSDTVRLDWPREMIQETVVVPKLVYSCNPLYFNFRKLHSGMQQNVDGKMELKKHKHKKKRKKSHSEKTEAGNKDVNSLDVNKDKSEASKSASQLDATKQHTKKHKNLLDPGIRSKKSKKSAAKTGKPIKPDTSPHSAQSSKCPPLAAEEKSRKRVSDHHSHGIQLTAAENALSHLVKDTNKSRWDTSSDSEIETNTTNRKTAEIMKSKVPASSEENYDKTVRHRSRSRSLHWSSDDSARSRKRSRYRSTSSSASSYSHISSSYRSSSCSYHRHRQLTHNSSRSSSSYSYSASNYSCSSRSYSRSRSASRHRRRSGSYSRSRSSSLSRSPPNRRFGGRLLSHRDRSSWQSHANSKQPPVESVATQKTKPCTRPPKTSKDKTKTLTASEAKNSSDVSEPTGLLSQPSDGGGNSAETKESTPVNVEDPKDVASSPVAEDIKSIPTPEEHMQSIPLPVLQHPAISSKQSFIGPVLPTDHPLAHKQDIPLPPTAKFQRIGPNDPLVFRRMPPPPPPPASLTSHSEIGKQFVPPPRPPSPPAEDMEDDIAGDEDPIPQMLDVKTLKPATFIPPEQDEQYGALRRQAELHARRQRIREETGMDIVDDEEEEGTEAVQDEQLDDQVYLDEAAAEIFSATPVLRLPQQHLVGQPLSSSVAMMASGSGLVPIQMVQAAGGAVVGVEPSLVSLVQQNQTPTVLAVSPAAAALARAQEEAEAEAHVRQQVAAAQAIAAAQRQRAAELVQLLPGHLTAGSPALATLRPAGLPLQAIPVHALAGQQPQQQLIQLPAGRIVGVPNVISGGVQVIAQPQAQPTPLIIGPNGTILRLLR